MNIHSKFLVHWTGEKDIENEPQNIQAQRYVERLKDYYQNGLFLKRTEEAVLRGKKIKNLLRLCFTEIRLSQAQEHANRYGKLGIGFSRDFIMNKGGRPVIYIPYKAEICLLENSLKAAYDNSEEYEEIHRPLKYVLSFIKRMSDRLDEDYYDEMEWRIVHDENPNVEYFTKGKEEGVYRFKFAPSDIKVIIFPNDETKNMSFNDKSIKEFFSLHMPITVTLDDCDNF